MAAQPHQPGSQPAPGGTVQQPSGQHQPVLARCLPPTPSPLSQQAPTEDPRAFLPLAWYMNTAGLALLAFAGLTAHAGSAHPACTQQAHHYRGRALPYGLSSMEGNASQPVRPRHGGTTAVAEQGNQPIKYLTEFLVHVKDCWMLLRLRSACCHLAAVRLQRE